MRRYSLIAALAFALGAGPAAAQNTWPTPNGNVVVPGVVPMCFTLANNYVPCNSPGAVPLPVQVWNNPLNPAVFTPANPQMISTGATGTTGAVTATLTPPAGKTVFICGFDVTAIGGTAAVGPISVTGVTGGTLTYYLASAVAGVTLPVRYAPCIQATKPGQAIAVATTADGTASNVGVNLWGVLQ